jgi:hypothetical protein
MKYENAKNIDKAIEKVYSWNERTLAVYDKPNKYCI